MPSGATHDRITLWISPLVAGLTWVLTQSDRLTLITVGTFLAGGLLLSPDLDIRSRPYKRWGWLRWLWLPYQKSIRHRSWLSHGWIIGTLLRLVYLGFWISLFGLFLLVGMAVVQDLQGHRPWLLHLQQQGQQLFPAIQELVQAYRSEYLAGFIGLELGAMSHGVSDGIYSGYERCVRGWQKSSKGRSGK